MAILQYDFRVVGINRVMRAVASVEKRFVRHNAKMARMYGGPVSGSGAGRSRGDAGLMAQMKKTQAAMLAIEKRQAQERVAINRRATRQIDADERALARRRRNRARARLRRIKRGIRERKRAERAAQARFRRGVGLAGGAVSRGFSRVSSLAAGALAIGGGFALSDAIGTEKRFRGGAASLANQAFGTTAAGNRSRSDIQKSIVGAARGASTMSGFSPEQVVGAMRTFHGKAGDVNAATALAPFFADVADATGAELEDVGETAGQIFMAAMAQGMAPDKALDAVKKITGVVAGQAKSGAIEMRDMATQMGKLMSSAGMFKGDVADLANTMGAMGQLAIAGGASSPEEAMTALMRYASDIGQKGGTRAYRKHGVNVFADKSKTALRDPAEIMMDAIHKTGGSIPALGKMFGIRSKKAVEPFRKVYVEAGGGEAGLAAMRKSFNRFRSLKMSGQEITQSAGFRRAQDDKQFEIALVQFKSVVGSQLLPAVTELIPVIARLTPHFVKLSTAAAEFIEWFSNNPIKGVGVLIAASVAKDLAAAGIGAGAKSVIETALQSNLGKNLGAVAIGLGGLALAIDQLMKLIDEWSDPAKDQDERLKDDIRNMKALGEVQTKVTRAKTVQNEDLMPWDMITGDTMKTRYLRQDEKTGQYAEHDTAKLYGGGIASMGSLADALKQATSGGASEHKSAASALKEAAAALKASAGKGGPVVGGDPTVPRR